MYALKQGYEAMFQGFNIGVVYLPSGTVYASKTQGHPRFQNFVGDIFKSSSVVKLSTG